MRGRFRPARLSIAVVLLASLAAGSLAAAPGRAAPRLERVSTIAPFPRGLAMVDGELHVLCRGRVRGAGGVTADVDDQAGTIYAIDPGVAEPAGADPIGEAVRTNGRVVARPTAPPFRLWDRTASPPSADRLTDRPYCTLRYHEPTDSFYICAFSGVDKRWTPADRVAFSKNLSDAVLRYDRRTARWYEVERHDIEAGGSYPHHDPRHAAPPHGWLNGPDNCLALGDGLYVAAKDNSLLVRYDLAAIATDPEAGPPSSEVVMDGHVDVAGQGPRHYEGQSALAYHDGWLYIGYRTSSVIVRVRLDAAMRPVRPIRAELVARFDPYDPVTVSSPELTDMSFDDDGRLYAVCAKPARVHRIDVDAGVYDARGGARAPWLDLAAVTGNPRMKCENILCHGPWLFVTSGDGYHDDGAAGTVYRARLDG